MSINDVVGLNAATTTDSYALSLHDALPIFSNIASYGLSLQGNALSNIVTGNQYDDTLNGENGKALFRTAVRNRTRMLKAGYKNDTITHFKPGTTAGDVVRLDGYGYKDFATV